MMAVKIAVSGIGAVGGYYGGLLAHQYQNSPEVEVYFISRGENMKVIQNKGLEISMPDSSFVVRPKLITDQPEDIGEVDFLLCCTKSYDLKDNLLHLAPVIGKKTVVIPFLNGANITEQIKTLLPDQEIWQGCVYIGARLLEPGVVSKYSVKERLFFGSEQGSKVKQEQLLTILVKAGINAFNPQDITTRIWKKFFMISTAATITSYYNKPIDEVVRDYYDSFKALCTELKQVASAKGVLLDDDIIETTLETQKMMPPGSITSMHHDFKQGKNTELENLTGFVVNEARKLNIATPFYDKMYAALSH
ncbi:ketopantoate reductase family protein [Massilibacteroides vaginae]|uniref:ketopantoate reductase family protein n=1 Tax=Massilibacteroides vaginae TaxID=1673718 RepID=UPI0037445F6B